ncbi:MAG: hypothetical protein NTV23_12005 [Propionibacteriales bacterium]|nr:hypothetical protein [Propionibacteriales bacterium]
MPSVLPGAGPCNATAVCEPGEFVFYLYGFKDGVWLPLGNQCRAEEPRSLTPALISHAFERIPLPHLRVIAQPADKTLVNFDTIFHVEAEPLDRSVTLLGQRVDLTITPSSFRWTWGDGTTTTTTTPGAPYPSRAVTHRYLDLHDHVTSTVAITWTARWRTNGGAWADVPGTVTTTGPAATLRVVEAVPNLAGPG